VAERPPRLTAVMGLARALIDTVGAHQAVDVLTAEFGWDLSFQALAVLRGRDAGTAFGVAWERLLVDALREDLGASP
jgi:hypothetical protein